MLKWWDVKIDGRYEGKPLAIEKVVQARDELRAVRAAVGERWPDHAVLDDWTRLGRRTVARFWLSSDDGETEFNTDHQSFTEMATEITDPARIARLNGDPMLPLPELESRAAQV